MPLTILALLAALAAPPATADSTVDRGAYLVEAVMACGACHSPRGPDAEVRRLSGGPRPVETADYTVWAGNITQDRATGIGEWTDAEIARAVAEGVRPDGARMAPEMPSAFYRALTPDDLAAVVAYLRTVPAVENATPESEYRAPVMAEAWPDAARPAGPGAAERGRYLAALGYCMSCHARGPDGRLDPSSAGAGGHPMTGPWGEKPVANITAHPEAGVGDWSDAELARALTEGVGRDGKSFIPPMARQRFYSRMTAPDIADLVAWIRSLPPRG